MIRTPIRVRSLNFSCKSSFQAWNFDFEFVAVVCFPEVIWISVASIRISSNSICEAVIRYVSEDYGGHGLPAIIYCHLLQSDFFDAALPDMQGLHCIYRGVLIGKVRKVDSNIWWHVWFRESVEYPKVCAMRRHPQLMQNGSWITRDA